MLLGIQKRTASGPERPRKSISATAMIRATIRTGGTSEFLGGPDTPSHSFRRIPADRGRRIGVDT
jgi:hypothetical protein